MLTDIIREYYRVRLPEIIKRIELFLESCPPPVAVVGGGLSDVQQSSNNVVVENVITRNFDEKNSFGIIIFNSKAFHQILRECTNSLRSLELFFEENNTNNTNT